jgi:hypothetical protein
MFVSAEVALSTFTEQESTSSPLRYPLQTLEGRPVLLLNWNNVIHFEGFSPIQATNILAPCSTRPDGAEP